jgi:hypothetical protein
LWLLASTPPLDGLVGLAGQALVWVTSSYKVNRTNALHGLISLGPGESSVACVSVAGCVQHQNLGRVGTLGAELELRRAFG